MGIKYDRAILAIAILIIVFSLSINVNLGNILTGYSIKEIEVSVDDLKNGVELHKGSTRIVVPEELIGYEYKDVFESLSESLNYVNDDWRSNFLKNERIYISEDGWWRHRIYAYKSKGWFTDIVRSREIFVNLNSEGLWLYYPTDSSL